MIAKCKLCGKEDRIYAKGLCMGCYRKKRYHDNKNNTKFKRRLKKSRNKWIQKIGRTAYNRYMRNYMRKYKKLKRGE